jgi:hypothetical protein
MPPKRYFGETIATTPRPGSVVGAAEPRASSFLGIGLLVLVLARKRFA